MEARCVCCGNKVEVAAVCDKCVVNTYLYILAYREKGCEDLCFCTIKIRAASEDEAYEIGMSTVDDDFSGCTLVNNCVVKI